MPSRNLTEAELIEGFRSRTAPAEACDFARRVTSMARPSSKARAKALLFALSKLAAFGLDTGAEMSETVLLDPYFVDRFLLVGTKAMAAGTVRTLRTNLVAVSRAVLPKSGPERVTVERHHAKAAYSRAEIDAHIANALAQPTESRRMRATGLIALGAGAGLVGADLRAIRGGDIVGRSGGLLVEVGGKRPRVVPVISRYGGILVESANFAGDGFIVGGRLETRRNVASPVTSSIAGEHGPDRLDTGRLRSTWLEECAKRTGLAVFMAAAGMSCSQRLGDIVAGIDPGSEEAAVGLLG
jgi:integrase